MEACGSLPQLGGWLSEGIMLISFLPYMMLYMGEKDNSPKSHNSIIQYIS
jgi:hypothetical protein